MSADVTIPTSQRRQEIFNALDLTRHLKHREMLRVGALPIHCELYRSAPDAPVILFLPGIGTYSELYCEFLAGLARRGYNVISIDPRGHGYSGGDRGDYCIEEVVADLGQVLDAVEARFSGPIGLLGCSLGARLGLAVAEADARIRSLLCHTLFLSEIPPDLWHLFGWNSLSLSALYMPGFRVSFRHFVDVDALLQNNPMGRYVDEDDRLVWDYPLRTLNSVFSSPSRAYRESLPFQAAILCGEHDEVLSPEYMHRVVEASTHPFELFVIPGACHMLPFEHIPATQEVCDNWFSRTLTVQAE